MIKDEYMQQLPSKKALAEYICNAAEPVHKRDIAHHFKLKGQARVAIKRLLRELEAEGAIERDIKKSYRAPAALPEYCTIEIIGTDADGELLAKPVEWDKPVAPPVIFVNAKRGRTAELSEGDKAYAQLKKLYAGTYQAKIIRSGKDVSFQVIGVFRANKNGGTVHPTDKKNKEDFFVPSEYAEGAETGDLVVAEQIPPSTKYPRHTKPVRIAKILGRKDDPKLISLISIHAHGIPTEFSAEVLNEAEQLQEAALEGKREDLRHIPLVTIDGLDARDFDDAVFAEPDTSPQNEGGWHLMVAIADVSHYVRPGSSLDVSAFERGNSTYFADRVVPMLPERLSNDLCSLRPHVNRACLACHLWINQDGKLLKYRFVRGLMRSAARLTYEEVEEAHLGKPNDTTAPLCDTIIKPLYQAYSVLKRAREKRGALELDIPERKAIVDDKGILTAIVPRERLGSHQLVEEFMILANVAAARALEEKEAPCLYRVHDRPSPERLESARDFLKELGYSLPKSDNVQSRNLNQILLKSADQDDRDLIHTLLLRTQSSACYSPDNIGHFGLALEKYAHFTSPIRRYADLIVHRSLVKHYALGKGGLSDNEHQALEEIAEHISFTERRSMMAERDVMDRFTAQYLSTSIGQEFKGKINGVTHFGLFVTLDETGADGLVPIRTLPRDFYIHDEKRHALVGKDTGRIFKLAQPVVVRLVEANPVTGSTIMELAETFGSGTQNNPRRHSSRKRAEGDAPPRHKRKKQTQRKPQGKKPPRKK